MCPLAQTNLRYGDAAQLVGGYAAGMLALSCLTAAVYLGLLARCALLMWRHPGKGKAPAGSPAGKSGEASPSADRRRMRPLGPWLWPTALINMCALVLHAGLQYSTSDVS